METLRISGLKKRYKNFEMDGVTFDIPQGSIVGLIGENGAGKSTIIKSILGVTRPDGGKIIFQGKEIGLLSKEEKQQIAYVFDDIGLPMELDTAMLEKVCSRVFCTWNSHIFWEYAEKFSLPKGKVLKEFSKGMKLKAAIAVAVSYDSKLLVLDEPTSGLDPIARDDILSLLYDYNQSGDRAILLSSHITTDLEKICDYIVFLHAGRIVMSGEKDALLYRYGIYGMEAGQVAELDKGAILKKRVREYGVEVLAIKDRMPNGFEFRQAGLEDIMLFYTKGENV